VRIPNSQLLHQRITNISQAKRSQVKQILRFHYADLNKLPTILQDIKEEVKVACPEIVSEGAIYRAVVSSFESDHVEAIVNFHFDIPAETEASNRNRQQVLLVIARVIEEHGVEFALPTFTSVGGGR
jgi:small-conductance mechanosensitive channel